MRVLIDMQGAQTASRFRGIGRYSLSLTQAMARLAAAGMTGTPATNLVSHTLVDQRHPVQIAAETDMTGAR